MYQRALTIVHAVFSSRLAGGERHCVDLAQAQAAMGHRVHIVGTAQSAVAAAVGPTVQFHGLRLPLARGARFSRIARQLGADVCHGHLGPACKAVAQSDSGARLGTLHVGYKAHHHARMDGLVCVNAAQQSRLGDYAGDSRVIYNWAPQRDADDAGDLRAELGLSPQQLLVGTLGRLNKAKGFDLLIEAFRASAPRDAVLAILGDGEEMAPLRKLAGEDARIRLLGYRTDVNAALEAMDLFVSSSREECFPLAILEAMRAGVPVLSTATQGPVEMLASQPAQLVPVGDVPALGRAIASALDTLRQVPRSQRGRVAYDVSAYDRRTAVERVVAFYRQVLVARSQPVGMPAPQVAPHTGHA